jgi:hypothetical protein
VLEKAYKFLNQIVEAKNNMRIRINNQKLNGRKWLIVNNKIVAMPITSTSLNAIPN